MGQLLASLQGWRTIISHSAQIALMVGALASVIATYAGGINLENGLTLAAALTGIAQIANAAGAIFQRLATQSVKDDLAELPADVMELKRLLDAAGIIPKVDFPAPGPGLVMPDVPIRPIVGMFVFMLLASEAYAIPPTCVINGPRVAEAGEEIILDVSQSNGEPDLYKWSVYPELKGRKQITILEGGKKIRLASFPGVYLVRVIIANKDGIDDHEWTVTIPGNSPCPPAPTPGPTPIVPIPTPIVPVPVPIVPVPGPVVPVPPMPDGLPAGEFDGLPSAVRALALAVVSDHRPAEAAKLAEALEAIAAQLAAGTLKNPISIVSAIGTAFNGSVPAAWDTEFRAKAVAKMKAFYEAGKLNTPDRWAVMLREVAAGLHSIK